MAISLDTLNATVISPAPAPIAYGVAFDTKTGKAVWSEQGGSIKRAYPNGTDLEVLRTGTGKAFLNHDCKRIFKFTSMFAISKSQGPFTELP